MHCPECGEEVHLTDKYLCITWLYCENCNEIHTIRSHGQNQQAIKEKQRCFQEKFEKEARRNGDRAAINRLLANNQQNQVNMHSPNNRVESAPGTIRTRYTYRNVKGA